MRFILAVNVFYIYDLQPIGRDGQDSTNPFFIMCENTLPDGVPSYCRFSCTVIICWKTMGDMDHCPVACVNSTCGTTSFIRN